MKKLFVFLLYATLGVANTQPLSDIEKCAFVDFYREEYNLLEKKTYWGGLPRPGVTAFFFDLNGDGQDEAMATCWIHADPGKEAGSVWEVYVKKPTTWKRIKNDKDGSSAMFDARRDGLYVLTRENESPLLTKLYQKTDEEYMGYQRYKDDVFVSKDDDLHDKEELGDGEYCIIKEFTTTSSFSFISINEEGYLEVKEIVCYVNGDLTEELDKLFGEGKYTLEDIEPVTYTNVPALKSEELAQLAVTNTALAEFLVSRSQTTNSVDCNDDAFVVEVPSPLPQNEKSTFIKKWLPVFVVVVLYAAWRVTRQRFQNKTRHQQPPTTE